MHSCQRVFNPDFPEGLFAVTDVTDEQKIIDAGARLCGKPAFYKQINDDGSVELWICVDCFNEFEGQFGIGSWTDSSKFGDDSVGFKFTEAENEDS